jgi:hypothetical protein
MRTEKLLFRWIGDDIERMVGSKRRANLTQQQREKYLRYLDNALDPQKGLFAKVPKEEFLGETTSKTKRIIVVPRD